MTDQEYREAAEQKARELAVQFPGLTVELAGSWVWVSGATRSVRAELKAAGLRWSPKKERWYYRGAGGANRRGMPWDYIRDKYGAERVESEEVAA